MKKTQTRRQLEITFAETVADLRGAEKNLAADHRLLAQERKDLEDNRRIAEDANRLAKMSKTTIVRETLRETADDYGPDTWSFRDAERDVKRGMALVAKLKKRVAALRVALAESGK